MPPWSTPQPSQEQALARTSKIMASGGASGHRNGEATGHPAVVHALYHFGIPFKHGSHYRRPYEGESPYSTLVTMTSRAPVFASTCASAIEHRILPCGE